ncbi:MAG TPA: hypothetical protein PKO40_14320 [Dokdonella sp.]|jgi:hypothetical protein|uniref:hypothetical protein n=1 Tax=Dokdonella sp. TaxID=2291710 RepID=UPI002CC18E9E|nr:hypothetical protein [Dokdonella sp.]HNV09661.1 hypothetical protein [Dokdonella sp.]HPW03676.1 hypothetical protein [Dokdonella sp.]
MNARSTYRKTYISLLCCGALMAFASAGANAQSFAALETDAPVPATLMPEMTVTASISNPGAPARWKLANTRPQPVTLMPTLTVRPDLAAVAESASVALPAISMTQSAAEPLM